MATGRRTTALADLRTLFTVGRIADQTDGQLLDRFARPRDQDLAVASAAFEALVMRHGPMVLAACRKQLRDPNDVEDAFQATFLVLIRKAGSIRNRVSLAGWLHRVARRIAVRARIESDRRRAVEEQSLRPATSTEPVGDVPERSELSAALHEEIDRLPSAFRSAIVLCHLEGRTHEQAAAQLRCPVGTVRSRLSRGRDRLRARLARRGWSPSAIAPVIGSEVPTVVPASLREATLRTASRYWLGETAVSGMSPVVASLAGSVVQGMALAKLKAVALLVFLACGVGGAGVLAVGGAGEPAGGRDSGPADSAFVILTPQGDPIGQVAGNTPPDRIVNALERPIRSEPVQVSGVVRDTDGEPIAGATVVVGIWEGLDSGFINIKWGPVPRPGQLVVKTLETDPLGRFDVTTTVPTTGEVSCFLNVFAYKEGFSADCWKGRTRLQDHRGNEVQVEGLTLSREPGPYVGVVQTREGEPIAGAEAWIESMKGPPQDSNAPLGRFAVVDVVRGTPIETQFLVESDADGRFRFPAVPPPYLVSPGAAAEGMADFHFGPYIPGTDEAPFVIRMWPAARVEGRVTSSVPGVEAAGRHVLVMQTVGSLQGDRTPYGVDGRAPVSDDGRFAIDRLNGFDGITLDVLLEGRMPDDPWTYRATPNPITLRAGETAEVMIEIVAGVQAEGVVRDAQTGEPVAGAQVRYHPGPLDPESLAAGSAETDPEGRYRLRVPPGTGRFFVSAAPEGYVHDPVEAGHIVAIPDDAETFTVPAIELRSADGDETLPDVEANEPESVLVAPQELRVRTGVDRFRVFAVDEDGRLIFEGDPSDRLAVQTERPVPWAAVAGVLDHRAIRTAYAKARGVPSDLAHPDYVRVDLERQRRSPDGAWSGWEAIDVAANRRVSEYVTHVAPEQTLPEVRLGPLVDRLPYSTTEDWSEVDPPRFRLPEGVEPGPGNPVATAAPEVLIRRFDYTVEPGATYRYRARIVAHRPGFQRDDELVLGPWSEPSEAVTTPAIDAGAEAEARSILQEASRAASQLEPPVRDLVVENLASAVVRAGDVAEATRQAGSIGIEDFRRNALRRIAEAGKETTPGQRLRLSLELAEDLRRAGDIDAARKMRDRAVEIIEALPLEGRSWERLVEIARLQAALGDRDGAIQTLERAAESAGPIQGPFGVDALARIAIARADVGDEQKARDAVRQVLEAAEALDDGPLVAEHVRETWMAMAAQALATIGEREQAGALVTRVVEAMGPTLEESAVSQRVVQPGVGPALTALAMAQLTLGRGEAARVTFQDAMRWTIPQNQHLIARTQAEAGDIQGAIDNALAVGAHSQSLENIAQVQAQAGDVAGALETATRIPREDPARAGALAWIAEAQARSGDQPGADARFHEAREILDGLPDGQKARAAGGILYRQAAWGDLDSALSWARRQESPHVRSRALTGIAEGILRRRTIGEIQAP